MDLKGSVNFTVEDLQSSTTYSFNILAFNEKGESDYTTDVVQKVTKATEVEKEAPDDGAADPPPDAPPETRTSEVLLIVAGVGGCLLICNLALLYCYVQRRQGLLSDSTMSRSSILEMYFSSSDQSDRADSQSVGSENEEDLDTSLDGEEESEGTLETLERVDRWRRGQTRARGARPAPYSPSPPPWPQETQLHRGYRGYY